MSDPTGAGGTNAPATTTAEATASAQSAAAVQAAVTRAADISSLCSQHGVPNLAADLIRTGQTIDQARAAVLTDIAVREMRSYLDAINQTNVEDTQKNKNKMLLKLKLAGRVLSTI